MEDPFKIILERLDRIERALEKLNSASSTNDNELMNVQQVAKYISLAVATIYGLVHSKSIPHFKTGKRLYFY